MLTHVVRYLPGEYYKKIIMSFWTKDKNEVYKSVFIAFLILLAHVILLAGIGVTVVLFKGVYHYLPWILGGIGILIMAIAWAFYQQMKAGSSDIKDILLMPEFRDRTVEVKLLGGLASFKVTAKPHQQNLIDRHSIDASGPLLIENDINKIEQKILKLTTLFEKDLITQEEFDKAKQNIIQG